MIDWDEMAMEAHLYPWLDSDCMSDINDDTLEWADSDRNDDQNFDYEE